MNDFRLTTFRIETLPNRTFMGWTDGSDWNGWARPQFEFEAAKEIANTLHGRFDMAKDVFVFADPASSDQEVFGSAKIKVGDRSIKVWPIGADSWIWEEAEMEVAYSERWQWMRNKEGGQDYGNQEEIRPLDDASFKEHVLPRIDPSEPRTWDAYKAKHPNVTHYSVVWRMDERQWRFVGCGSLEELRPKDKDAKFALRVERFDSPSAMAWWRKADSEDHATGTEGNSERTRD